MSEWYKVVSKKRLDVTRCRNGWQLVHVVIIRLKEGLNELGVLEFYIVGFDYFEDFDLVKDALLSDGNAQILDQVEGIYSRTGTFSMGDLTFKLFFHEDVGIYLQTVAGSKQMNDLLRKTLGTLLPILENSIS